MEDDLATTGKAVSDSGRRSLWTSIRSAGPTFVAFLAGLTLIFNGSIDIHHHRSTQGLFELFAGISIVLIIAWWRFILRSDVKKGIRTLAESPRPIHSRGRTPWFEWGLPAPDWTPPTWPELLKISIAAILVGAICFFLGLNQILYVGSAGQQFFPYIGAWFLLLLGILVWAFIPIGLFNKVRWHLQHSKRRSNS